MNAYDRITERIIALLERGTVPWHQPWKASTSVPRNLVTKKTYRGINVFLLVAMGYESPFWLTFRQAVMLGGSVKQGEKLCPVVFWKRTPFEDEQTGEKKEIPLLRFYHVFNSTQCEGLPDISTVSEEPQTAWTKPTEIIAAMPRRPVIRHGMTQAAYLPNEDVVNMPEPDRFDSSHHYYAALYHELVHATGHETRLNRSTLTERAGYGSDPYCKEELVAEMSAAFLCSEAEIIDRTIDNSAAYLQSWLARLRADKTLVVQAAALAQRATDFILNRQVVTSEARHD